jgi:hypothetical protein
VELQQPLALLDVALAPREILGVPRVHQINLKAPSVEDLVDRNPVDAGRLHRDRGHAALLQPVGQPMQVGGEALKATNRVGIPIRPDRDVVGAVADVDPGGVGMHHVQPRVIGPELPREVDPPLPSESAFDGHAGAPLMSQTRCGPVAMGVSVSPTGSRSSPFLDNDRPPCQRSPRPGPCC